MDHACPRQVVEEIRQVAERLEGSDCEIIFPGWGPGRDDESVSGIRAAARAIAADDISPDDGLRVPGKHIGKLLYYIADMIE